MRTNIFSIENEVYRIVTVEDLDLSILGVNLGESFIWDKNSVIIIDDKMYPNNPALIKVWDDEIQKALNNNDLELAWGIFLSKPNKRDSPWITHINIMIEDQKFDFTEYMGPGWNGYWERHELVTLKNIDETLRDWSEEEEDNYGIIKLKGGATINRSNPEFINKIKRSLIDLNFGSMVYDW